MHWVNADEPEEYQWGFIDFVSLLAGAAGGCMLSWGEFANHADYTRVFENYRRLIKLLLWKHPPPDGGFLVLKAPQVANHLPAFSSGRAMVGGIVDGFISDDFEPPDPFPVKNLERAPQSILDFHAAASELVTTVDDPALVADPAAVAAATYAGLGLPVDPHLVSNVDAFLQAQRPGARARPPAVLPEPGLSHDQPWRRSAPASGSNPNA